jgi:hypothetical protein
MSSFNFGPGASSGFNFGPGGTGGGGFQFGGTSGAGAFHFGPSTGAGGGAAVKQGPGLFGSILHDIGKATVTPIGHALGDIGTAGLQLGPGIYDLGKLALEDPSKLPGVAKGLVHYYENTYDPLHPLRTLSNIYNHPGNFAMDVVLPVATLGAGSAVRGAALLSKMGIESETAARVASLATRGERLIRSPVAEVTGRGPALHQLLSTTPIVRLRQLATMRLTRALDDHISQYTGTSYFQPRQWGKLTQVGAAHLALKAISPLRDYEKIVGRLSPDEMRAYNARPMGIHPANLKEYWGDTPNGKQLTPEVMNLMENPTPKMLNAERFARGISERGAEIFRGEGVLSRAAEEDRPGRFRQQVSEALGHPVDTLTNPDGSEFEPYYQPHVATGKPAGAIGSHPTASVGGGVGLPRALGTSKRSFGTLMEKGLLELDRDVLGPEFARRVKWQKFWNIHRALRRGALRVSEDDLSAADPLGRPILPKGYQYIRTVVPKTAAGKVDNLLAGLEKRQARFPSATRLQAIQRLRAAQEMYRSGRIPDSVVSSVQKIPPWMKGEGEGRVAPSLADVMHNSEDLHRSAFDEGFHTEDIAQAFKDESGRYYIIPKAAARAAAGEFTRMGDFAYRFVRQPLRIWRSALLGLRPAYFVNNAIGNSLMYAMKTGGKGAIRDLLMSMYETHGPRVVSRLLKDSSTPADIREAFDNPAGMKALGNAVEQRRNLPAQRGLAQANPLDAAERPDFYRDYFPEQLWGTQGYTQSPAAEGLLRNATSRAGRGYQRATQVMPHLTAEVTEMPLRRAMIRNLVRRSPEFKQVYQAMPRETRTFELAARRLMQGKGGPAFQRMISQEVDHALGNYTRLNGFERNVARNVLPFYAWYRAVFSTSMRLALNTPIRASLLYNIGQIGAQQYAAQVAAGGLQLPSYYLGALPLGAGPGGTERILNTQILNPWATLGSGYQGLFQNISAAGLNPFVEGALQTFASAQGHGKSGNVSPGQLLLGLLGQTLQGMPGINFAFPPSPSKLQPYKGRMSVLESWLGVPIKEINPAVSQQQAMLGR